MPAPEPIPPFTVVPFINRETGLFADDLMQRLVTHMQENLPAVPPEDIAAAVESYFEENPLQIADIQGLQEAIDGKLDFLPMTEVEYHALPVKDPNTLYVTTD